MRNPIIVGHATKLSYIYTPKYEKLHTTHLLKTWNVLNFGFTSISFHFDLNVILGGRQKNDKKPITIPNQSIRTERWVLQIWVWHFFLLSFRHTFHSNGKLCTSGYHNLILGLFFITWKGQLILKTSTKVQLKISCFFALIKSAYRAFDSEWSAKELQTLRIFDGDYRSHRCKQFFVPTKNMSHQTTHRERLSYIAARAHTSTHAIDESAFFICSKLKKNEAKR